MREIKFRAWSKLQNKLIYPNHHPYSIEKLEISYVGFIPIYIIQFERTLNILMTDNGYQGKNPSLNGHWEGNKYYDHKDWEEVEEKDIMQFTGLLDKNGKEIYEGDIIKILDHPILKDEIAEVTFCKGAYVLFWIKDPESLMEELNNYCRGSIIIGNIYENKELLK
jgi:hypothetical protein